MTVALLSCGASQAAVGVPENIVLYRVDDSGPFPTTQVFVRERTSASSFDFTGNFLSTAGGTPNDLLNVADINGDGTDDLMVVQDVSGSTEWPWLTIGTLTTPGDPPTLGSFGAGSLPQRVNGSVAEPDDEFVITRRDFDGDGLADTAVLLDGSVNFEADVLAWQFHGTFNDESRDRSIRRGHTLSSSLGR